MIASLVSTSLFLGSFLAATQAQPFRMEPRAHLILPTAIFLPFVVGSEIRSVRSRRSDLLGESKEPGKLSIHRLGRENPFRSDDTANLHPEVIRSLKKGKQQTKKGKQQTKKGKQQTPEEESPCSDEDRIECDSAGKKILVCHYDKKDEIFEVKCVKEKDIEKKHFKDHEQDYCGVCRGATVVRGSSVELTVTSCDPSSVTVQGSLAGSFSVGSNFVYGSKESETVLCVDCSPLYRRVVGVQDGPTDDSKILLTEFATVADLISPQTYGYDATIGTLEIEPTFECDHTTGISRRELQFDITASCVPPFPFPLACNGWAAVTGAGDCFHTNCHVGNDSPFECFSCDSTCGDSGCGAKDSVFQLSGNIFDLWDFGPACCIHDYCYASVFGKARCDEEFFQDMVDYCPDEEPSSFDNFFTPGEDSCFLMAGALHALVQTKPGVDAYNDAKLEEIRHELSTTCEYPFQGGGRAGCPTVNKVLDRDMIEMSVEAMRLSNLAYETAQAESYPNKIGFYLEGIDAVLTAKVGGYCVAAFRRTIGSLVDDDDCLSDTDTSAVDLGGGCDAHEGFFNAYSFPYRHCVEDDLRECKKSCPSCDVVLTGHSQGGGIAAVGALFLRDLNPFVITFGAPQGLGAQCGSLITNCRWFHFVMAIPAFVHPGLTHGLTYDVVPNCASAASWLLDDETAYTRNGIGFYGHEIVLSLDDTTGANLIAFNTHDTNGPFSVDAHGRAIYLEVLEGYEARGCPIRTTGFMGGKKCTEDYECLSGNCGALSSVCDYCECDYCEQCPKESDCLACETFFLGTCRSDCINQEEPALDSTGTRDLSLCSGTGGVCCLQNDRLAESVPETCEKWAQIEEKRYQGWVNTLETNVPCPCYAWEAEENARLEKDFLGNKIKFLFHPGADRCYRGSVGDHGQQCCYAGTEDDGECLDDFRCYLSIEGLSGGTVDKYAPGGVSQDWHVAADVKPFTLCAPLTNIFGGRDLSNLGLYHKYRPISNSNSPPCVAGGLPCGNGRCDTEDGEDSSTCPLDCDPCGDGVCTLGETAASCPADCFNPPPVRPGCETSCSDGSHISCGYCCPDERYCEPIQKERTVTRCDPVLLDFRGRQLECNAEGEFVLLQSSSSSFQIQARFSSVSTDASATVTTGLVVADDGYPTIQISFATKPSSSSIDIGGCPVQIYVDQSLRTDFDIDLLGGGINVEDSGVILNVAGRRGTIRFDEHSLEVHFSFTKVSEYECFIFHQQVDFPVAYGGAITPRLGYRQGEHIYGLIGSPYEIGKFFDRFGQQITLQSGSPAAVYSFCTNEFCIKDETESLFTYEEGLSFSDFEHCDAPYVPINIANCPQELAEICGDDAGCLIDCAVGGAEAVQLNLESQFLTDMDSSISSDFRFDPTTIEAQRATSVNVTVELSTIVPGLMYFLLYPIDNVTLAQSPTPIAILNSTGTGFAGDVIYSGFIDLVPSSVGTSYGFRAIPVINEVQENESGFVKTKLNAVRSYRADVLSNMTEASSQPTEGPPTISPKPSLPPSISPSPSLVPSLDPT